MIDRTRRFMAALAAAMLLFGAMAPSSAMAATQAEDSTVPVVFDVIIMRPVGFATLLIGTGLFVGSLPILLITRPTDIATPADFFMGRPARFLWKDSLGAH